ncbi:MAG: HNH endonuclease, partial [Alphaproteobacteria bacterium]
AMQPPVAILPRDAALTKRPMRFPCLREDRNWWLHGIGNLTLISGSLNKELSHGPWIAAGNAPSKRAGLQQHSKLDLNARLLRDHPDVWDEAAMKVRAESLFDTARHIWPAAAPLG